MHGRHCPTLWILSELPIRPQTRTPVSVVVSHGDGLYSLYLYLQDVSVVQGRFVDEGDIIGTVGGADTPEGPHLEFQIRGPVEGSAPRAIDPLLWLRSPSGR